MTAHSYEAQIGGLILGPVQSILPGPCPWRCRAPCICCHCQLERVTFVIMGPEKKRYRMKSVAGHRAGAGLHPSRASSWPATRADDCRSLISSSVKQARCEDGTEYDTKSPAQCQTEGRLLLHLCRHESCYCSASVNSTESSDLSLGWGQCFLVESGAGNPEE